MRIGTIVSIPDRYSVFARIKDNQSGVSYTVDPKKLNEGVDVDDEYAYKVDLWENDSGLVYHAEED